MFTVKATYRAETRKFVLPSDEFPTYQSLQDQLYRVFPISSSVYLSKVLFSPRGDDKGRILLILEAHNEDEYETHIKPYRGQQWPGAVLRFSVFEETPHKLPSLFGTASPLGISSSPFAIPHLEDQETLDSGEAGPDSSARSHRLRSLLERRSSAGAAHAPLYSPSFASQGRTLPPPPPLSSDFTLPRLPSLLRRPAFNMPEVRVQAPTPTIGPPPPPPPPPMPNRLRPVVSMPTMTSPHSDPLAFPGPPPLPPPPPPPPRPTWASPWESDWTFPRPPLPYPVPPPLPAKPFERQPSRGSYKEMIQRIAASRLRTDVDERSPALPSHVNTNRHSWAGPDAAASSPSYNAEFERRRDEISKRLHDMRERARFLADERRRKIATLPGSWNYRDQQPFEEDDSTDNEKENRAAPMYCKPNKGKGKERAVTIESASDSEDDLVHKTPQISKGYNPTYTAPIPGSFPASSAPVPIDIMGPTNREAEPVNVEQSHPCVSSQVPTSSANVVPPVQVKQAADVAPVSESLLQTLETTRENADEIQDRVNLFVASIRNLVDNVQQERTRQLLAANNESDVARDQPAPARSEAAATDETVVDAPKPVHRGVRCDVCDKTIEGVRHKCLDCPDYDLCTPCLTNVRVRQPSIIQPGEARVIGGHQANHMFFAIEEPGDLWLHATFRSANTAPSNGAQADTTSPARANVSSSAPIQHYATCDLCDSSIINKRYKCLQCPDWDVCEQCFSIVADQHPGHGFVCITDPHALQQYHEARAVPRARHHARCDECGSGILGIRFKCMHPACRDYDLCANCEALPIPVHPSSHPLLKIRAPDTIIPKVKRYGDSEPEAATAITAPVPAVPAAAAAAAAPALAPVTPASPASFVPLAPPASAVASVRAPSLSPGLFEVHAPEYTPVPPLPQVASAPVVQLPPIRLPPLSAPSVDARPLPVPVPSWAPPPPWDAQSWIQPQSWDASLPLPRLPTPPSFVPTTSPSLVEERFPPIEVFSGTFMPGGLLPLSPPLPSPPPPVSLPREVFARVPSPDFNFRLPAFSSPPISIRPDVEPSPITFPPASPVMDPFASLHDSSSATTRTPVTPRSAISSRSVSPVLFPPPPPPFFPPPESAFAPSAASSPEFRFDTLPQQDQTPLIDLAESNNRLIDLTQSSSESQPSSRGESLDHPVNLAESRLTENELGPALLPQVPPTDLHELFDLAAHFRHLWTSSSGGARTPNADSPVKAGTDEVASNVSPPTDLASSRSEASDVQEPISIKVQSGAVEPVADEASAAQSPLSDVEDMEVLSTPPPSFLRPSVLATLSQTLRGPPAPSRSSVTDASASRPVSFITDDSTTVIGGLQPDVLRAAYVADNNIPDGQVFPPGAEFVKSWAMRNDGSVPWPETTELVFVAGDRLQIDDGRGDKFKVGTVYPGEVVDVWTGEMKVPDVPGKYISYWRLSDGQGNRFGHSIWVDITVVEPVTDGKVDSDGSLSSSSIIMPQPPSATSASQPALPDEATTAGDATSNIDDDAASSSVSFIDVPSDDEGEDIFEDSRSHVSPAAPPARSPDVEYVVLYDSSDDEDM